MGFVSRLIQSPVVVHCYPGSWSFFSALENDSFSTSLNSDSMELFVVGFYGNSRLCHTFQDEPIKEVCKHEICENHSQQELSILICNPHGI